MKSSSVQNAGEKSREKSLIYFYLPPMLPAILFSDFVFHYFFNRAFDWTGAKFWVKTGGSDFINQNIVNH